MTVTGETSPTRAKSTDSRMTPALLITDGCGPSPNRGEMTDNGSLSPKTLSEQGSPPAMTTRVHQEQKVVKTPVTPQHMNKNGETKS
jgi:hypothetical protein